MQEFWDAWVATKGRAALRPPRIFRAPVIDFGERTRVFSVLPNPSALKSVGANKDLYDQYKDCLNHLQLRKKAWKRWRGVTREHDHIAKTYTYWQRTPYALMECRNCVEVFAYAAARHDESTCTHMINALTLYIDNFEKHAGPAKYLSFVYRLLKNLMKAAIPWHEQVVRFNTENPAEATPEVPNKWRPSRSALSVGTGWRFPDLHEYHNMEGKAWKTLDLFGTRFRFYTPYDARHELIEETMQDGQQHWTVTPTPLGLVDAVRVLAHEMRDALDAMADENGNEMDENTGWLPFNFRFPKWTIGFEKADEDHFDEELQGEVYQVSDDELEVRMHDPEAEMAWRASDEESIGSWGKESTTDEDEEMDVDEEEEEEVSEDSSDLSSEEEEDESDSDVSMGGTSQPQAQQNQPSQGSQGIGGRLKMFLDIGKLSGVTQALKSQTQKGRTPLPSGRGISKPQPRSRNVRGPGRQHGGTGGPNNARPGTGSGLPVRRRGPFGGQHVWRSAPRQMPSDNEEEEEYDPDCMEVEYASLSSPIMGPSSPPAASQSGVPDIFNLQISPTRNPLQHPGTPSCGHPSVLTDFVYNGFLLEHETNSLILGHARLCSTEIAQDFRWELGFPPPCHFDSLSPPADDAWVYDGAAALAAVGGVSLDSQSYRRGEEDGEWRKRKCWTRGELGVYMTSSIHAPTEGYVEKVADRKERRKARERLRREREEYKLRRRRREKGKGKGDDEEKEGEEDEDDEEDLASWRRYTPRWVLVEWTDQREWHVYDLGWVLACAAREYPSFSNYLLSRERKKMLTTTGAYR